MSAKSDFDDLALPTQQSKALASYLKVIIAPILGYVFILLGYLGVIKLQVHLHTAVMMGVILLFALIFALHSAEYAQAKIVKNLDDFKVSLKKFIMQNLLQIAGSQKSSKSFDEFARNYTKELRNDHLASIGTGVFPMLGILGTFISIAISMPSFGSKDAIGLEKEIGILLNGVGTAFYVSVYGIFLALWWMFFERIGMSKFERFLSQQRELSAEFFWQKNEIEQRFMGLAANYFTQSKALYERISADEFFNELDSALKSKFNALKELQITEERLLSEASIRLNESIVTLGKSSTKQDEILRASHDIALAINAATNSLKTHENEILSSSSRLDSTMGERLGALDKQIARFDNSLKALDISLKSFSVKLLEEQNRSLEAFKASMIEGVSAFNSVYQSEKPSQNELKREAMLGELKRTSNELSAEVERVIKQISDEKSL